VIGELRDAGVTALMIGFEFVTDNELQSVNKTASLEDNNQAIKICKQYDIDILALFIVDPDWHHSGFRKLARYIRSHKLPFALYSTLTVFPGTQMAHNQIIPEDPDKWWRYDLLRLQKKPKYISSFSYYLWLFYLYLVPGMQFATLKKFHKVYGTFGIIKHAIISFFMGLEFLVKLLIWK